MSATAATQVTQAKQKKKKQEHKAPSRPLNPDPEHLVLAHTNFQDPDGDVVQQIPVNEVEAEATGVGICTLAQAYHFLQSKQSISTRPFWQSSPHRGHPRSTWRSTTSLKSPLRPSRQALVNQFSFLEHSKTWETLRSLVTFLMLLNNHPW